MFTSEYKNNHWYHHENASYGVDHIFLDTKYLLFSVSFLPSRSDNIIVLCVDDSQCHYIIILPDSLIMLQVKVLKFVVSSRLHYWNITDVMT